MTVATATRCQRYLVLPSHLTVFQIIAKVEGRGNGIKTRIPNCYELASSLHRPPSVVTKFFGCELGAQSKWDDKEQSCIVNGEHQQNTLQNKLCDEFLPRFVLCVQCKLPETDMKVLMPDSGLF